MADTKETKRTIESIKIRGSNYAAMLRYDRLSHPQQVGRLVRLGQNGVTIWKHYEEN